MKVLITIGIILFAIMIATIVYAACAVASRDDDWHGRG